MNSNNEAYLKNALIRTAGAMGLNPLASPEDVVKKAFELYRIAFQNETKLEKKIEECIWIVTRANFCLMCERSTYEEAKSEAERLAGINPNAKFLIWRSVGCMVAESPVLTHIIHMEKGK